MEKAKEILTRADGLDRDRARNRPGQSSFAFFHADTPGGSVAAINGRRAGPAPAEQTLRAAMDWSYDLLSAAEQKLFQRLSCSWAGAIWKAWKPCATHNVISIWICRRFGIHGGQKAWCSRLSKGRVNRGS